MEFGQSAASATTSICCSSTASLKLSREDVRVVVFSPSVTVISKLVLMAAAARERAHSLTSNVTLPTTSGWTFLSEVKRMAIEAVTGTDAGGAEGGSNGGGVFGGGGEVGGGRGAPNSINWHAAGALTAKLKLRSDTFSRGLHTSMR
jgi:hypothetical protein